MHAIPGCTFGGRKMRQAAGAIDDSGQTFMSVVVMEKAFNEQLLMSVQMNVNDGGGELRA